MDDPKTDSSAEIIRYGIPLTSFERRMVLWFRGAAYGLMLAYCGVLVVNGIAIAAAFSAKALVH
jgi:hypothetical protein